MKAGSEVAARAEWSPGSIEKAGLNFLQTLLSVAKGLGIPIDPIARAARQIIQLAKYIQIFIKLDT